MALTSLLFQKIVAGKILLMEFRMEDFLKYGTTEKWGTEKDLSEVKEIIDRILDEQLSKSPKRKLLKNFKYSAHDITNFTAEVTIVNLSLLVENELRDYYHDVMLRVIVSESDCVVAKLLDELMADLVEESESD